MVAGRGSRTSFGSRPSDRMPRGTRRTHIQATGSRGGVMNTTVRCFTCALLWVALVPGCGQVEKAEETVSIGQPLTQLLDDHAVTVTAANAAQRRQQLISYIWGTD